jgi:hypothetical protein
MQPSVASPSNDGLAAVDGKKVKRSVGEIKLLVSELEHVRVVAGDDQRGVVLAGEAE